METMKYIWDFLKADGVWFIALLALVQPWCLALWSRYFRKAKIEIYMIGHMEIGYSSLGPNIGLIFTLRSMFGDLFVKDIQLELVKQKDSSKHSFNWSQFLGQALTYEGKPVFHSGLPSAFVVLSSLPRDCHIIFSDFSILGEMREFTNALIVEWWKVVDNTLKTNSFNLGIPESVSLFQTALSNEYIKFVSTNAYTSSLSNLDRKCYWESGKYTVKMTVSTSHPDCSFQRQWDFVLNDFQVQTLRRNVIKLLDDSCGRPSLMPIYNIALAPYEVGMKVSNGISGKAPS